MAGPIRISILADSRGAVAGINRTADASQSLANRITRKVGPALAVGFGLAAAAAVKFGTDAVEAASNAEQSIGATQAIYGKYAKRVIDLSEKAADAVGLSSNAYRESSNLLGALFKNQGVAMTQLSATTDEHVRLAADLSAMYGGPVTDAVDALTAAYKGEFNQLEKYGVTLKQDTINTAANALAKKKYGKELKDLSPKQESLAKQMATQSLLFGQTKDAAGAFGRESDTVANKSQKLAARFENIKATIGAALLPILVDLADFAGRELVPQIERLSKYINANKDDIRATAREWGGKFLDALERVWSVIKPILVAIDSLPGPIKSMAAQAAVAALILPKVAAALLLTRNAATAASVSMVTFGQRLAQNYAAMTYATGVIGKAQAALWGFGGAARTAAGIGGMLALTKSANEANDSMRALERTAGLALLGFAVGGPMGAAIGGTAGLALSFDGLQNSIAGALGLGDDWWQSQDDVRKQTERTNAIIAAQDDLIRRLRDTVNGWTTSAETNALAHDDVISQLDKMGFSSAQLDTTLRTLGITHRDLAKAAVGDADAIARIGQAYTDVPLSKAQGLVVSQDQLSNAIDHAAVSTDTAVKAERRRFLITQDLHGLMGKLPKRVVTSIESTGIVPTAKGIANIARQYKLTPKQIRTVIDVTGVDTSVKQVSKIVTRMQKVPAEAKAEGGKAGKGLAEGTGSGLVNNLNLIQNPFRANLANGAGAKGSASSGGRSVGQNLASGTAQGIYTGIPWVTTAATIMALRAKQSAETTLGIRSPSRVFRKIGQYTVQGLILGMQDGADGVDSALSKITSVIEKAITGKNEKARESALKKRLRDEYAALRANGRAQDAINAKLEKAKERLSEVRDWVDRVKQSFVETGNVVNLGKQEDGTVSSSLMLDQLRGAVVRAQRFAALIRQLSASGLNKTSLDQLLTAGPEAALASAEALAAGGSAAVAEVNSLTAELAKQGEALGSTMSDKFFTVGLRAAEGIVAGLQKQQKALDKAAERMANALIAQVKRALGIKSPSREFRTIGDQVVKGLGIGLDNTYVKRQGAALAGSLQQGFGQPALAAVADARSSSNRSTVTIRLTAEQVSQLQRGREIRADLDAFDAVGRRRAS